MLAFQKPSGKEEAGLLSKDYGFYRVISPRKAIPQTAYRLDNAPEIKTPREVLIAVHTLNLDSTSMREIRGGVGKGIYGSIEERIREIVRERGKMHNPVTESGGVLVGSVRDMGEEAMRNFELKKGDAIIPVASLSTIPLHLRKIGKIQGDKVEVEAEAVLFPSLPYTGVPEDFDLDTALSAIDISSIVPQIRRTVQDRQTLLVIGAGKAGVAAMAAAREAAVDLAIIAMDYSGEKLRDAEKLGCADRLLEADATSPEEVLAAVEKATEGKLCDLVINCVNVPGTEASSILACKERGVVFFFSMATKFDKAALGTDATGKDVSMLIGNGVARNQAKLTFDLLRRHPELKAFFQNH
jgi:L-erythro-3,5-diaminohexanoate dehydrogenase